MTKQSVLVTGANGQLGSSLRKLTEDSLHIFSFVDIDDLDLCDSDAVNNFFASNNFDWIVNCAAYTNVDGAETDQEEAWEVNVSAVQNILNSINDSKTRLIHISTDFVFNGKKSSPYIEDDQPDPVSFYGKTKHESEKLVLGNSPNHIVVRTSWLYSKTGKNFVKTILNLAVEKPHINVVYDQIGTPTYSDDLANVILTMLDEKNIEGGIYHYSNEGVASWYDFAHSIIELSGSNCKVNPITTGEYPTPAKRPNFSVMNKSKIKSTLGIEIPHWRDSLSILLKELNEKS